MVACTPPLCALADETNGTGARIEVKLKVRNCASVFVVTLEEWHFVL